MQLKTWGQDSADRLVDFFPMDVKAFLCVSSVICKPLTLKVVLALHLSKDFTCGRPSVSESTFPMRPWRDTPPPNRLSDALITMVLVHTQC